jgi:apolipoprotein N-acyltransferase
VVVVQPNMDPYTQQFTISPLDVIDTNINLAKRLLDENVDFIASPESAIQENIWIGYLDRSPSLRKIEQFTGRYENLAYVIGASTFREFKEGEEISVTARKFKEEDAYYDAFNTALLISDTNTISFYHKSKLTPGVERMPYPKLFKPLERFALDLGGTVGSLGLDTDQKIFSKKGDTLKIAPVICFESVFGEYFTRYIRNGAHLIFVITNDGWWGNSPGHRQHFTFSRLRAIETRRSVARSANTGRSAFINQLGDVFQPTEYWEPAVIRQKINANDEITFYVVYGDYIARISSFVALFILLIAIANRFRRK